MNNKGIITYDITKIKKEEGEVKVGDFIIITKENLGVYTGFLGRVNDISETEIFIQCIKYEYGEASIKEVSISRKDESFKMEFTTLEKFNQTFEDIIKQCNERIAQHKNDLNSRIRNLENFEKNFPLLMKGKYKKEEDNDFNIPF